MEEERFYPLGMNQVVKSAEEKAASKMLSYIAPMHLQEKPEPNLLAEIFQQIARLGAIHTVSQPVSSR